MFRFRHFVQRRFVHEDTGFASVLHTESQPLPDPSSASQFSQPSLSLQASLGDQSSDRGSHIFLTNPDGDIKWGGSGTWHRRFGLEVEPQSIYSLFNDSSASRVKSAIIRCLETGSPDRLAGICIGKEVQEVSVLPSLHYDLAESLCVVIVGSLDIWHNHDAKDAPPDAPLPDTLSPLRGGFQVPTIGSAHTARDISDDRSWELGSSTPARASSASGHSSDSGSRCYSISEPSPPRGAMVGVEIEIQTSLKTVVATVATNTDIVWEQQGFQCKNCARPPRPPRAVQPKADNAARAMALSSLNNFGKRQPHKGELQPLDGLWTILSDQHWKAEDSLLRLHFTGPSCLDNAGTKWALVADGCDVCLDGGRLLLEGWNLLHHESRTGRRLTYTKGNGAYSLGRPLTLGDGPQAELVVPMRQLERTKRKPSSYADQKLNLALQCAAEDNDSDSDDSQDSDDESDEVTTSNPRGAPGTSSLGQSHTTLMSGYSTPPRGARLSSSSADRAVTWPGVD